MPEDGVYRQLCQGIAQVDRDVFIGEHHPLKVGGTAAYGCTVRTTLELVQAVKTACDLQIPYRVLGTGQSTLWCSPRFVGLVIWNACDQAVYQPQQSNVLADAGLPLHRIVLAAAGHDMGGLLAFYGQSVSLGGAIVHGARCNGVELLDSLRSVSVLHPPTKMRPDPWISKHDATWLRATAGMSPTRLAYAGTYPDQPEIVIAATLQLTQVRADELARRIRLRHDQVRLEAPNNRAQWWGPLWSHPIDQVVLRDPAWRTAMMSLRELGLVVSLHQGWVYLGRQRQQIFRKKVAVLDADTVAGVVSQLEGIIGFSSADRMFGVVH
jgi:UDP-N-acetylenolpyruvoylglucosamine reductase